MRVTLALSGLRVALLAVLLPLSTQAQLSRPIVAVFAHPDDERIIGPLLSRHGSSLRGQPARR